MAVEAGLDQVGRASGGRANFRVRLTENLSISVAICVCTWLAEISTIGCGNRVLRSASRQTLKNHRMRITRFHFGCYITILWIVLMCFAVQDPARLLEMKLNELGDFLAGFFAPLAFLWLVLGYLQQGEELQHSTRALQLQAEELRNSVEQQRELVEVTRQQLESEREASALEQRNRIVAAKPLFVFTSVGGTLIGAQSTVDIDVQNKGGDVTKVLVCIEVPNLQPLKIMDVAIFERTKIVRINQPLSSMPTGAFLKITYVDAFKNLGTCCYLVRKENYTSFPWFELVEA